MSISSWLARKGSVGGAARWAGKLYLSIKRDNPSASPEDVMSEIVRIRYASASTQSTKEALLSHINSGDSRGLAHLVVNILTVEADFQENTQENRFRFMKIIQEELRKFGIAENVIYDERM